MTGETIALLLTSSVVAALVAGAINIVLARRHSRDEELARIRAIFAEAYEAYAEYREFPFAIHRRNPDSPASERIRLSELIRQTQQRLHYYLAWTKSEAATVGKAYEDLIAQARATAGQAMRTAWNLPPVVDDTEMSITVKELAPADLRSYEEAYTKAVAKHLSSLGKCWQ